MCTSIINSFFYLKKKFQLIYKILVYPISKPTKWIIKRLRLFLNKIIVIFLYVMMNLLKNFLILLIGYLDMKKKKLRKLNLKFNFQKNLMKIYSKEIFKKKEIEDFVKKNRKFIYKRRPIIEKEVDLIKNYFQVEFFEIENKKFSCVICQSEFFKGDSVLKLNKSENYYNNNCIYTWFQNKFECPLSRRPVCLLLINKIHGLNL